MTTEDRPLKRTSRWLIGTVVLLLAGLVATTTIAFWPTADDTAVRGRIEAAARRTVIHFTTYDYRHLASDIAQTSTDLNATFKAKYTTTMKQLSPTLIRYKASSSGKILDIAVESTSSSGAVAIAFLDQTIANSASTRPQVDHVRMRLTLTEVDGAWLASGVVLK